MKKYQTKREYWAVFNSERTPIPRAIFSAKWQAEEYIDGMDWGYIKKILLEFTEIPVKVHHTVKYYEVITNKRN